MEEGTLAKWHVKVGDTVKSGDIIAEIETDKATMEVEAVDEGVVEAILIDEGAEGVKVNTPIARLAGGEAVPSPVLKSKPPAALHQEPSPPCGERVGRGGASCEYAGFDCCHETSTPCLTACTPTPDPSPQGGGESRLRLAVGASDCGSEGR